MDHISSKMLSWLSNGMGVGVWVTVEITYEVGLASSAVGVDDAVGVGGVVGRWVGSRVEVAFLL